MQDLLQTLKGNEIWLEQAKEWAPQDMHKYFDAQIIQIILLDDLLESINSSISFIQYKRLTATLLKHAERCEREYYGNSTNYAAEYILMEELYEYCKEKEWI